MKNTENCPQKERLRATVETVKSRLSKDDFPSNKQLIEICKDFGISPVDSGGDPHLVHEILETSLNLYLSEAEWLKSLKIKNKHDILARLEDLTSKLPPQSRRGLEQIGLQQFSTPPALAFLMAEIPRPKRLLQLQNFESNSVNAEFLDNFLPAQIKARFCFDESAV